MNQLRRDPVTGRWSIILTQEKSELTDLIGDFPATKQSVEACPFCEGNEYLTPPEIYALRPPGSKPNSPGWQVRVIPDRYPILEARGDVDNHAVGIYDELNGVGKHEILVEHPKHDVNIPEFTPEHLTVVLQTMQLRIRELKKDPRFRYVLIHKNYGEASGNTLKHAYSQILATPITPRRMRDELVNAKEYFTYKERCVFCDIVSQELETRKRVVLDDGQFLVFEPFAAGRPFETWIIPRRHETFFEENTQLEALARILIAIFKRLKDVLHDPHYILSLHNGPNISVAAKRRYWKTLKKDFHWHFEIVPRLRNRSSFELGSGIPLNPVPPEQAAAILRENL